ncbi:OprP Phosphate-selective porin [Methylophilaceae bacterium]
MNFKLRSLVAATLAGSMLMGFGTSAMADSTDDILNALIAKGILTEEEGALLQKGRTGEKEAAAKKKETAVSIKNKDGSMVLESGDGKNSMALTGRMQFDMRSESNNATANTQANKSDRDTAGMADQFELRRARIGVKGKMFEHFDYEVIANVVGSNTNIVDVAYVNAGMYKQAQLKLGQFKQPFNLEEYGTSSNNIDFMERSYVNQLTPAKKTGAMLHGVPATGLTYAASVYQQNNFGETDNENTGKGFAGRATVNFAELAGWGDSVFHVGAAGFDSEYGVLPTSSSNGGTPTCTANTTSGALTCTNDVATNGTVLGFRSAGRGLANAYRVQIGGNKVGAGASMPSNAAANVENKAYGLELAMAKGPFKIQGEYTDQVFNANQYSVNSYVHADVKAYYVEALVMLTGENYANWYKNGAWGGIKPTSNFDLETGKGKGAWELGVRFDAYDVSDVAAYSGSGATGSSRTQGSYTGNTGNSFSTATGQGGGAKTYTVGLKWQLTPNMRVLANYAHTKFDDKFTAVDTSLANISKEDLLMVRSQFSF